MKKIIVLSLMLAALGVVLFWIFLSNVMEVWAGWSIIVAGVFALVADVLFVCDYIREHKYY